jgi:hypothetical protein
MRPQFRPVRDPADEVTQFGAHEVAAGGTSDHAAEVQRRLGTVSDQRC